ncbi:MAG: ABC transporter permease [Bacillota bacterium]
MSFPQAIRLAFMAMWSSKLRTFLTMLGIIIGVFAVVALVSIGQGATSQVTQQVQSMGSNLITIMFTGRSSLYNMSYQEAMELADKVGVKDVSPMVSGQASVKFGTSTTDTTLEGTNSEYHSIRNYQLQSGRFLVPIDVEFRQKVVVLGADVVSELFSNVNPLGQEVRINGTAFTVVGVLEAKGASMGRSEDDKVIIPISTAQRLLGNTRISTIYVQAESPEFVDRAIASIEATLLQKFRNENAYRVMNQTQILETMGQITSTLTLMLGGIAGISLLVGGIGIMNIMLVSVTERTREIGINKALGAKKRDILSQFLVESAVISITGGIIGLVLGYGLVEIINKVSSLTAIFSFKVVLMALLFSLAVGVFFGLYPANKASNLNPIDALRAE